MEQKPKKRGHLVQDTENEPWMVYEPSSDSLHSLNQTARAVWELCDGETTPDEMARGISELTGMALSESKSVVIETVADLADRSLVDIP